MPYNRPGQASDPTTDFLRDERDLTGLMKTIQCNKKQILADTQINVHSNNTLPILRQYTRYLIE